MLVVQSFSMPKLLFQEIHREFPDFKLWKYCSIFVCIFLFKCLSALAIVLYISIKIPHIFDTIFEKISIENKIELFKKYPNYLASGATICLLVTFIIEYYFARKFYLDFNHWLQLYLINKKFTDIHPRQLVQLSRTAGQHVFYGLRGELEFLSIMAVLLLLGIAVVGIFLYLELPLTQHWHIFAALGIVIAYLGFCIFQCSKVEPLEIKNASLTPEIIDLQSNDSNDSNNINYYRALLMTFLIVWISNTSIIIDNNNIKNFIHWVCIILSLIMTSVGAKNIEAPAKSHSFLLCLQSIENCWWGRDNSNQREFIIGLKGIFVDKYQGIEFEDFSFDKFLLSGKIYNFKHLSERQFTSLGEKLTGQHGASEIVTINGEPISKQHLASLMQSSMNDKVDKSRTIFENMREIDPGINENTLLNMMQTLGFKANIDGYPKFNGTEDKYRYLLLTVLVAIKTKSLVLIERNITSRMDNGHWGILTKLQQQSGCIIIINDPEMENML
jgi:hypothetical protein